MSTIRARFDDHVFVSEGPVPLPPGGVVDITLPTPAGPPDDQPPLLELVKLLDRFPSDPNWPPDAAAQHDHYLYGAPKRP